MYENEIVFNLLTIFKAEHIERIERKITEVLKRDGSRKVF